VSSEEAALKLVHLDLQDLNDKLSFSINQSFGLGGWNTVCPQPGGA